MCNNRLPDFVGGKMASRPNSNCNWVSIATGGAGVVEQQQQQKTEVEIADYKARF
jgi:hypothetical protein